MACFSAAATTGESRGEVGLGARCCPRWKAAEGDSSATRRLERSMVPTAVRDEQLTSLVVQRKGQSGRAKKTLVHEREADAERTHRVFLADVPCAA